MSMYVLRAKRQPLLSHLHILVCLLIVIASFYYRIANLNEARFIDADEYRALGLSLDHTLLFRLIYSITTSLFSSEHSIALYTSVTIGILTIVIFYRCTLLLTKESPNCALFAATLLAMSPVHVLYSRMAYPVALQTLVLVLAWSRVLYLSKGKQKNFSDFAVPGLLLSISLMVYVPSYLLLVGISTAVLANSLYTGVRLRIALIYCGLLLFWACISYVILSLIIALAAGKNPLDYYVALIAVQQWGREFVLRTTFWEQFYALSGLFLLEGWILTIFFFCSFTYGVFCSGHPWAFMERFVSVAILSGLFFFLLMVDLGFHTLSERHLVQLIPPLCLLAGLQLANLYKIKPLITSAILACLMISSVPTLNSICLRVYRIAPIVEWFNENGIGTEEVATLVDLTTSNQSLSEKLPVIWNKERGTISIDWVSLENSYHSGKTKYVLISDFYMIATSGERDRLYFGSKSTPIQSWPHPVCGSTCIRLYDLEAIFDRDSKNIELDFRLSS